jgi:pyruvate carboxylase
MNKLLALNRGEIAIRILRAANELGLRTVAIYSQEDRLALHRFKADEAYLIGDGKGPVEAYLDVDGIVALAREKGVDAIHPGYGFLSENPALPRACERAGIAFIGPSAELLELLGDKRAARQLAQRAGIPTVPGTEDPITDPRQAERIARRIGFPLIVKAAFGGGGRGMRVVRSAAEFSERLAEARREAGPATSRCRSWAIAPATCCTSMSAIAPCSGGIKRWSKWPPPWASTMPSAARWLKLP